MHLDRHLAALAVAVPLFAAGAPAPAQTVGSRLTAGDKTIADQFGTSVDIDGDLAVVGAVFDDDAGDASGSAYVFVRGPSGWVQEAKLVASDAQMGDRFGTRVGISGSTVVVGSPRDDGAGVDSGSAYVFVRSGTSWSQQFKLLAMDQAPGDRFGDAVDCLGDTVVVGASFDDDLGSASGSIYVFTRSGVTWSQQQKIKAADGSQQDQFGASVAVTGGATADTIAVGAPLGTDAGRSAGSVYTFVFNGVNWTQQGKLLSSDLALGDLLGFDVALDGDTVIAGAQGDDDLGFGSGSAYVFVRNANLWSEQAKLLPTDGAAQDFFGISVAIEGDTALVGAWRADAPELNSGAVYVFARNGTSWAQLEKLAAFDGEISDQFGADVALSGPARLIGAPLDDEPQGDEGAAWIFEPPPAVQTYCTAKTGLACGVPAIAATGTSSAAATSGFTISASPARSAKTGVLLYTNSGRANLPFPQGGHILCVGASPLRRGGPAVSGGTPGPNCDGTFALDMNAFGSGNYSPPFATHNPDPFLVFPGQRVNCQWWGRDTPGTGSFMSDAVEYVVGP